MFCVINVTVLFLAPVAVACDTYFVRRSAHPKQSVFYILGKDFPNMIRVSKGHRPLI